MNKILLLFGITTHFIACQLPKEMNSTTNVTSHAIRLKPGEDVREKIENYVTENKINAGWIVTCAGSLSTYNLRFVNQENASTSTGHFEIVSLAGTLSTNGSHMHISISDSTGQTIGGHLLAGCIVYTTAEIILQSTSSLNFKRAIDGSTPWKELQIERKD